MQAAELSGLARAEELYKDRTQCAKELHKEGKKVIGYMCCLTPVEMFTAFMESDLVDERNYSEAQTKANVSAFIDTLETYKRKRSKT